MIQLTLAAPHATDPVSLVKSVRDIYEHVPIRLCIATRPVRSGAFYEAIQRHLPACRLVVGWSDAESMLASSVSSSHDRSVWWPVADCNAPAPTSVYELSDYQRAAQDQCRRPIVGCLSGYRSGDLIVADGHRYQAVDLPCGPVCYRPGVVAAIAQRGARLAAKIPHGPMLLALAAAMQYRIPAYVVPSGPVLEPARGDDVARVLAIAKECGWKSRVSEE